MRLFYGMTARGFVNDAKVFRSSGLAKGGCLPLALCGVFLLVIAVAQPPSISRVAPFLNGGLGLTIEIENCSLENVPDYGFHGGVSFRF